MAVKEYWIVIATVPVLHISPFPLSWFIFVFRGENKGSQTQEVLEQVNVLKAQISELEAQEKELDNQKTWLEENIKHLNHDPITSIYPLNFEVQFLLISGLYFCAMSPQNKTPHPYFVEYSKSNFLFHWTH